MTRMLSGEAANASRVNNLDRVGRFTPRANIIPLGVFDGDNWDNSIVEGVWHLSGLWCFIWARFHILVDNSVTSFAMGFELPWQPDPNLTALDEDSSFNSIAGRSSIIGSGYLRDDSTPANSRVGSVNLITPTGTLGDPHWVAGLYIDDLNTTYLGSSPFVYDEADNRGTIVAEYPVDPNELAGVR